MVPSGDPNGNGVPDRLEFVRSFGDPARADALRPFGVFGGTGIQVAGNSANSIYHALQTQLRSRFGRGSQFQASYTFSRLIGSDGQAVVTDPDDPALDRGLSPFSRKHLFNASLVLELPGFGGRSGFVRHVLGDWEIGAIVMAASGSPLTVYNGFFVPEIGEVSGTGYSFNQRPNRVPGEPCRASGGPAEQWLNPRAFTLEGMRARHFRQRGSGHLRGPGTLPGGPRPLQEHPTRKPAPGAAPLRSLQRLQPDPVPEHRQLAGLDRHHAGRPARERHEDPRLGAALFLRPRDEGRRPAAGAVRREADLLTRGQGSGGLAIPRPSASSPSPSSPGRAARSCRGARRRRP